ncbi:2-dehydro-3-deoxyphosphogluconate aldolase [Deltaproteobacteria bacterium Smac51]|nr:2-dehydro-3-deoxyphosphogluconate aldolase [Deltaproteobacteria bacterium Smac51]
MTHKEILEKIALWKIVPVIRIDDPDTVLPLADALIAGGLPVAEITLRSSLGLAAIKKTVAERPEMLVGAGTVLSPDDAARAIEAGAAFIVTPGFNPRVVDYCVKNNVLIVPGVNSPSTVEEGLEFGLTVLKFFPAEPSGGIPMLKALKGPYGHVSFMPTGGINAKNAAAYLALDNVTAIGGSWMVTPELLSARDFSAITRLSREAVSAVA